jgi:16S rRNA (guanine1207-N2)-methyltransferase
VRAGRGAPVDPLRKATLRYRQHGVGIDLEVLEGTFASAGVDAGTRHLLRWLADERYAGVRSVLDLGCGYGPLALWLAAADPARRVLAVDRDARALAATALGVAANGTAGVAARASLGYDDVGPDRVELIVSNVPAKIGSAALRHVVLDAHHHLVDGGRVALVVVERLADEVGELLADEAVELLAARPNRAYVSYEYSFRREPAGTSAAPGFGRGLYHRGRGSFRAGSLEWEADVAHSIAEFDELGHGTVAALEVLGRPPSGPVVVDGVGQGHLPLAVRAAGHAGELHLVDRDLLALQVAAANLGSGATSHHEPRLPAELVAGAGLTIVGLPEREPVAVTAAVAGPALAGASGPVLLHGRTTDVNRVLELLRRHGARLGVDREARVHGHRAVLARRR